MPKKVEYVKFRKSERKIKSQFRIYAYFESILMPEDNGKQNSEESYRNKYQKYIACTYGYKLVYVDDKFKTYLNGDAVYNFIYNSMIEDSKCCGEVIK